MITYDTHVHSSYSTDSHTPARCQLDAAIAAGMVGICLTDHIDYGFPPGQSDIALAGGGLPFLFDIQAYKEELRHLRKAYEGLDILTGIECGLQTRPDVVRDNLALSMEPGFDYVIGSLHLVGHMDPYYARFWEGRNPSDCVFRYFEELYENLCLFTSFDALGHLDYIVRYAPAGFQYEPSMYREILEEILTMLIGNNIALEVNTSGYRSSCHPNPHPDILALYRELGGELVTIGSDAHAPEFLAYEFGQLATLLKEIGLCQFVTFHGHRPKFHALDEPGRPCV